jgi:hypothetical protein
MRDLPHLEQGLLHSLSSLANPSGFLHPIMWHQNHGEWIK